MGNTQTTIIPSPELKFPSVGTEYEVLQLQKANDEVLYNILKIIAILPTKAPVPKIGPIKHVMSGYSSAVNLIIKPPNLQDALIDAKLDREFAKHFVVTISADIQTVKEKLDLFDNPNASRQDKISYLRIAENTCSKLLELIRDQNGIFWKYQLESTPHVEQILILCVIVAELLSCLDRAYENHLKQKMKLILTLAESYKKRGVEQRVKGIKSCCVEIDPVCQQPKLYDGFQVPHYLEDKYNSKIKYKDDIFGNWSGYSHEFERQVKGYKENLEKMYEDHYDNLLQTLRRSRLTN